jgi:hypothetical protein
MARQNALLKHDLPRHSSLAVANAKKTGLDGPL